jgi:pyroglutamyl-peptidase
MTARTKTESTSRILLTGFEPFDGRERNASWIAASALAQQHLPGVELRAAQIPVCWDAPRRVLDPIVTECQPHVIIGLGEGEPGMFRIESVANNTRRERADNDGKFPEGRVIDPRGPLLRTASADCITLCNALTALDIPVRVSTDAGAFLCEELLYTLEGLRAAQDALDTVLFVHVPAFGTALKFQGQQRVCDEALLLEFANLLLARVLTLPIKKKINLSE